MAADIKSLRDGGRQWKPIQAFVHHVFNVMTGDANEMVVGRKVSVESRSIVPVERDVYFHTGGEFMVLRRGDAVEPIHPPPIHKYFDDKFAFPGTALFAAGDFA